MCLFALLFWYDAYLIRWANSNGLLFFPLCDFPHLFQLFLFQQSTNNVYAYGTHISSISNFMNVKSCYILIVRAGEEACNHTILLGNSCAFAMIVQKHYVLICYTYLLEYSMRHFFLFLFLFVLSYPVRLNGPKNGTDYRKSECIFYASKLLSRWLHGRHGNWITNVEIRTNAWQQLRTVVFIAHLVRIKTIVRSHFWNLVR